jgi:hypothetical protein
MGRTLSILFAAGALAVFSACSSSEPPPQLNPGKSLRAAAVATFEVYGAQLSHIQNAQGALPEGDGVQVLLDAGIRAVPRTDPFGTEIGYHNDGAHWTLSSAGPDMAWGTPDDIVFEDGRLR